MMYWLLEWQFIVEVLSAIVAIALAGRLMSKLSSESNACPLPAELEEHAYGFRGDLIRAFSDSKGAIWLRMSDVRRAVTIEKNDDWFATAYKDGFGKAHPIIVEPYLRPEVLRRYWANDVRQEINHFLVWLNRDLVPTQTRRHEALQMLSTPSLPQAAVHADELRLLTHVMAVPRYFRAHWQGKHATKKAMAGAFVVLVICCLLIGLIPWPANITDHYRVAGFLEVTRRCAYLALVFWYGRGLWQSTHVWFISGQSAILGMVIAVAGLTGMLAVIDSLARTEEQLGLIDYLQMAVDADPKPNLKIDPSGERLVMYGEMGFGTTNAIRRELDKHPTIRSVELSSPGGRAVEGRALAGLIQSRSMDTVVRRLCASACVYAYAAGNHRYIGSNARFGLHRSGITYKSGQASGPSAFDIAERDWMLGRGINAEFLAKGMEPSIHGIWHPSVKEVLDGRLATDLLDQDGT